MTTVGSGDYTYEHVPVWPNMPKYWSFGAASDGAVNSKNEVHIFSRGAHPLTIWDTDGNFVSSWGEGTFSANPHGIYIAPNDNVWLVDRDFHIATEYTPGGETLAHARQQAGALAVLHRDAVQHAVRTRHRPQR